MENTDFELESHEQTIEPQITAPKKRGRPKKVLTDGLEAESIGGTEKESAPSGAKRGPKKRTSFDVDVLSQQLVGIHQMIALVMQQNAMLISDQEAKMLAISLNNISNEYGLSLSGKTGATIQLIGVCAVIYIPRLLAIRESERVNAAKNVGSNENPLS